MANCGSPLPAGPSLFYESSETIQEGLTVRAGDFTGSSTNGYGLSPGQYLGATYTIALGPNGNVYTLEYPPVAGTATSATVAEFLPNFGCTGPIATLNGLPIVGGTTPGGVAVDSAGYVYVASQLPRQLALYAPLALGSQTSKPLATVTLPTQFSGTTLELDPIGIALDASGRIYIANGDDDSIVVYPARSGGTLSGTPSATIEGALTGLFYPDGVAVDASGKIYVSDESLDVKVFAANPAGTTNEAPIAQITGAQTQITGSPLSIAVDHLGVIYVGAATSGNLYTILEFPPNPSGTVNEAPQGQLIDGVGYPSGLVGK